MVAVSQIDVLTYPKKLIFHFNFRKFPAKCAATWWAGGTCGNTSRTTRDPPSHSARSAVRSSLRRRAGMFPTKFVSDELPPVNAPSLFWLFEFEILFSA